MGREGWGGTGGGQEVLLEGQEGSGIPPEVLGEVGRPSRWAGKGRESHSEVWEWLGGPPSGPAGVGRKLTEIPWTHGNLTDVHAATRKVD